MSEDLGLVAGASRETGDVTATPLGELVIKDGDWIYTGHWKGPFLKVDKVTPRQLKCGRARLDHDAALWAGPSREGAMEAKKRFLDVHEENGEEMRRLQKVVAVASAALTEFRIAVRRAALAAARSEGIATPPDDTREGPQAKPESDQTQG